MKKVFLIASLLLLTAACSSSNDFEKGKQQLEQQGYTDVQQAGYPFFCCAEEDTFAEGFTAKDSQGNEVKGCMCSGLMKGVTIRWQ